MKFEAVFRMFLDGAPIRRKGWKKSSLSCHFDNWKPATYDGDTTPVVVYRRPGDELPLRTENGFDLFDMMKDDWELVDAK